MQSPWFLNSLGKVKSCQPPFLHCSLLVGGPSPGVMPTEVGFVPTAMLSITESLAVSITDTVFDPLLATYALVPSGVNAIQTGAVSTVILSITTLLARVITDRYCPRNLPHRRDRLPMKPLSPLGKAQPESIQL